MIHIRIFIYVFIFTSIANAQSWKAVEGKITSKWTETVNPENVWQEYPRPQFVRSHWKNLNGLWDYAILKSHKIQPQKFQGKILVPFSFESSLSGVGKNINPNDRCGIGEVLISPITGAEKICNI